MLLSEQLEEIETRAALVEWHEVRLMVESGIQTRTRTVMRKFPLFDLVKQEWSEPSIQPEPMEMEVYVNKNGDMIDCRHGDKTPGLIKLIKKYGIQAEKVSPDHSVCSIGKAADGKWYGWSHRAIVGFGIGDRLFDENYGDDNTPFIKHGKKVIKTDADAKKAAMNFARYVS